MTDHPRHSQHRRRAATALFVVALTCLFIGILGPHWLLIPALAVSLCAIAIDRPERLR